MNILFKNNRLLKTFNDEKRLVRKHGNKRADIIRRRLSELRAAYTLEVIGLLPGPRCHELKGDHSGQLSVDLDHPYRLIFEPADDPVPRKQDGGLDWSKVTSIVILGVEDTHD